MSNKPERKVNARAVLFGLGTLIIVLAMFLTDPDSGLIQNLPFGASTTTYLIYLSTGILGVGLLYICERAMFYHVDYLKVVKKAVESSTGAGLFLIAISLQSLAFAVALIAILK